VNGNADVVGFYVFWASQEALFPKMRLLLFAILFFFADYRTIWSYWWLLLLVLGPVCAVLMPFLMKRAVNAGKRPAGEAQETSADVREGF